MKVVAGEEVEAGGVLLEVTEPSEKIINISGRIGNLSVAEKRRLGEKLVGLKIKEGAVIFETKGMFPKKISLPITGEVVKIDEFENLHYKEAENIIRKVNCPVAARVVKNDGQSLEMEFRAIEYNGRGINEGRVWGTEGVEYVSEIADLSAKDRGKIILTEKFNQAWLIKAEVVGVSGVVIIDNNEEKKDDRINLKLPIIALEKSEWEELKKYEGGVKRAMVNASGGRLLLVV